MRKIYSYIVAVMLMAVSLNAWADDVEVSDSYSFSTSGCTGWSTDYAGSYCGGYGRNKSGGYYVANNSISNFSNVNFNIVTNQSVTIYVKALTNGGDNTYTVSLINSSGSVVGTPVTKNNGMGSGSNASSASESYVTLTPVAGTAGYRIDFPAKSAITQTRYTLTYTTVSTPYVSITTTPITVTSAGTDGDVSLNITHNLTVSSTSNFGYTFYAEDGTTALTGDAIPTWVGQSITGNNTDGYKFNYNISSYAGTTDQVARVKVYGMSNGSAEKVYSDLLIIKQTAKHTVTFNLSGGTFSSNSDFSSASVDKETGTYHLPSATKEGSAFDGWYDGVNTYAANAEYTVSTNVTFLAQWRSLQTYSLVTSVDDIVPGKHYIIANGKSGTVYAMGGQNSNNRAAVQVSFSGSKILETTGVNEFVLSGDATNKYTFYDVNLSKYLYTASNSSARLLTRDQNNSDDSKWTISFSNDAAIITCAGHDSYNIMRYNPNTGNPAPLFACYSSGQNAIYLYAKDGDTDGTIYSATTLGKNESYNNLTIVKTVVNNNPVVNGSITVPNKKTLTVTGTLTNQGDAANLVIADGGQLVTSSTGVQATVEKNISAWTTGTPVGGWYFIASPINSSTLSPDAVNNMLTTETAAPYSYDLYRYNDAAAEGLAWENYHNHTPFYLVNGQGYLYANASAKTLEFAGAIKAYNASANTITLSADGFHLIGNPYTFNAYINKPYYSFNEAGTTILASELKNIPIAPCTGVMVNGSKDEEVIFTQTSQNVTSANNGNIQLTLAHNVATRGGSNAETIDNAIISFNEGSKLGKFYFGNPSANIYIPQDNKEYAIVSAEAQGEMPVNFVAAEDGQYTITVNPEEVEMNYLHLIDNKTGNDVDLLVNPSYTFNAKNTDYASRFRLVFSANDVNQNDNENENFAFISNGQIILTTDACDASLQVIDIMGRIVSTEQVNGNSAHMAPVAKGVYVLRLLNNGESKTQKIVVK